MKKQYLHAKEGIGPFDTHDEFKEQKALLKQRMSRDGFEFEDYQGAVLLPGRYEAKLIFRKQVIV